MLRRFEAISLTDDVGLHDVLVRRFKAGRRCRGRILATPCRLSLPCFSLCADPSAAEFVRVLDFRFIVL